MCKRAVGTIFAPAAKAEGATSRRSNSFWPPAYQKSHRPSHHADVMAGPSLLVELAHLCLFHLRCQDGAPLGADVALSPYLQTERFSYAVASGDACKQFEIQRRGTKGRSDAIASLLMLPFSELMPTGGVEMCRTIAIELCCSRTVLHAKIHPRWPPGETKNCMYVSCFFAPPCPMPDAGIATVNSSSLSHRQWCPQPPCALPGSSQGVYVLGQLHMSRPATTYKMNSRPSEKIVEPSHTSCYFGKANPHLLSRDGLLFGALGLCFALSASPLLGSASRLWLGLHLGEYGVSAPSATLRLPHPQ